MNGASVEGVKCLVGFADLFFDAVVHGAKWVTLEGRNGCIDCRDYFFGVSG